MKIILLTGASGFIGNSVLEILLRDSEVKVRALVRKSIEQHPRLSLEIGDIRDRERVRQAVRGVDIVIHLAAIAKMWLRNSSEFDQINVEGTRNVLDGAKEFGSGRVVFASSMSIFRSCPELQTEAGLTYRENQLSPYSKSKMKAEMVIESARQGGSDVVIVYPTRVFGPGPLTDANAATVALLRYRRGLLPLIDGGKQMSNWAYVRDVAAGIVSAAFACKPNNSYILGGENRTLAEVLQISHGIVGGGFKNINISRNLAMIVARIEESRSKIFKSHPFVTPGWLDMVLEDSKYDLGKAVNDLDYRVTPIHDALRTTINESGVRI